MREGWKTEHEKQAHELEEANRTHACELAEMRERCKKAKETRECEINEALSAIARLTVVSH